MKCIFKKHYLSVKKIPKLFMDAPSKFDGWKWICKLSGGICHRNYCPKKRKT